MDGIRHSLFFAQPPSVLSFHFLFAFLMSAFAHVGRPDHSHFVLHPASCIFTLEFNSYVRFPCFHMQNFCCNGCIVRDEELGKVIQLQGDHRDKIFNFLIEEGIVAKDGIKKHGF
jgi:hypothetical protein